MIHLTGHLFCANQVDLNLVTTHLPDHILLSRAEPGCQSFDVVQTKDPLVWQVEESFATQADFDAHQTRTQASPWYRATCHLRRDFQLSES